MSLDFLEFEKPIVELEAKIEALREGVTPWWRHFC